MCVHRRTDPRTGQGSGATTVSSMIPLRDRLWHRLMKRGGEYFLSTRYAEHPCPILLVVDGTGDSAMLGPLYAELESSTGVGSAATAATGKRSDPSLRATVTAAAKAPLPRPPRVVLTMRGGSAASCTRAAINLGSAHGGRGRSTEATLCYPDLFASAWQLNAGRHSPRDGTQRAGGGGGRDHELMVDLAAGLMGAATTVRPLAIVSVATTGHAAGDGGEGGGGAAIDEATSVVSEQSRVPWVRLPRLEEASGAALWLARLAPEAFRHWNKARVDILVVYDPVVVAGIEGRKESSRVRGVHSEAQLEALLNSLSRANYLGDSVRLTVAIGAGRTPTSVASLPWDRGSKVVREPLRGPSSAASALGVVGDGGASRRSIATLVLRSWIPQDDDNFVVVLEANRVVSKFFYSWLKVAVLETNYTDRVAPQSRVHGVCLPASGSGDGVGRRGGERVEGTADAWLFSPEHWRNLQGRCIGGGRGSAGRSGEGACEREVFSEPPEHGVCPTLSKDHSDGLVALTAPHGKLLHGKNGLMDDYEVFADLARRSFFQKQ